MRPLTSLILAVAVVALAQGDARPCSIEETCCKADAGVCTFPNTCICQASCGGGQAICGCTCINEGGVTARIPNVSMSLQLTALYKLTIEGPEVSLSTLSAVLQNGTNWWIHADTNVGGLLVPSGTWTGSFRSVIEQLHSRLGIGCSIDEAGKTLTFHSLN